VSISLSITAGQTRGFSGTIEDANGTAVAITAGSDVLFKLYRGDGATPDLDLNGTALTGGSVTSFTAGSGASAGAYTVTICGPDTASLNPGVYQVKIELVDHGDSDRLKDVDFGVCNVFGSTAGKVT
jgi:hypothetical protein